MEDYMDNDKQLVLVYRDNNYQDFCHGSNCGSLRITFGVVDAGGAFDYCRDYSSYRHSGCYDMSIRCQWNCSEDQHAIKPYVPYAIRIEQDGTTMENYERRHKTLRTINKYLLSQPGTQDFGWYCFMVATALKIKSYVRNPDIYHSKNKCYVEDVKEIVSFLNHKVQEREIRLRREERDRVERLAEEMKQSA